MRSSYPLSPSRVSDRDCSEGSHEAFEKTRFRRCLKASAEFTQPTDLVAYDVSQPTPPDAEREVEEQLLLPTDQVIL